MEATLDREVRKYLQAARAPSTRRAYSRYLAQYHTFCKQLAQDAVPATPLTLARYVALLASSHTPQTILSCDPVVAHHQRHDDECSRRPTRALHNARGHQGHRSGAETNEANNNSAAQTLTLTTQPSPSRRPSVLGSGSTNVYLFTTTQQCSRDESQRAQLATVSRHSDLRRPYKSPSSRIQDSCGFSTSAPYRTPGPSRALPVPRRSHARGAGHSANSGSGDGTFTISQRSALRGE
jgi:hypothetical protein